MVKNTLARKAYRKDDGADDSEELKGTGNLIRKYLSGVKENKISSSLVNPFLIVVSDNQYDGMQYSDKTYI